MRKMLLYDLHQLQRTLPVIDGHNHKLGIFGAGRFEQIHPGGISVVHLKSQLSKQVNAIGVVIEDGGLYPIGPEKT